jgi:hypothetical protein
MLKIHELGLAAQAKNDAASPGSGRFYVSTRDFAKAMGVEQKQALLMLGRLERLDWIGRRSHLSGGMTGHGWGGQLYSEILVLGAGQEILARLTSKKS